MIRHLLLAISVSLLSGCVEFATGVGHKVIELRADLGRTSSDLSAGSLLLVSGEADTLGGRIEYRRAHKSDENLESGLAGSAGSQSYEGGTDAVKVRLLATVRYYFVDRGPTAFRPYVQGDFGFVSLNTNVESFYGIGGGVGLGIDIALNRELWLNLGGAVSVDAMTEDNFDLTETNYGGYVGFGVRF